MDWLEERIAELRREKLNCSQVMLKISLELRDLENPELVRAMYGLGGGLHSRHTCGTLTGGCCLLASYSEADRKRDAAGISLPSNEMIKGYVQWFKNEFGSLLCDDLLGGDVSKIPEFCPGLIRQNFEKCMEILRENGVDPEM